MTIHFDSWRDVMTWFLLAVTFVSAIAGLHWKIFAVPLLKKIFEPYGEQIEVHSRILRQKFPVEYEAAEKSVYSGRDIRRAL